MRITERFGERLTAALESMLTAAELNEIDYEVMPTPFPQNGPDGMSIALGMTVALSCPTVMLGDHALVMDICREPYLPDEQLRAWAAQLVAGLRKQRAVASAVGNGGLAVPGGPR